MSNTYELLQSLAGVLIEHCKRSSTDWSFSSSIAVSHTYVL